MIAWPAGAESSGYQRALLAASRLSLQSYLFFKDRSVITPDQFRFFLDSGAYSAWTKGTAIDIDEYCAFIRENIEHLDVYASLDVIPGKPNQIASIQERNEAAEQSWANYLYMLREGLDPIPVYHYGEDMRFLERMLEHGCGYIGIGGLVGVPSEQRRMFLDRVFDRITDDAGKPVVKTHGFGMTSIPLIFRYPWYSVDSTTWIKMTANGCIYLPAVVGDQFVFDRVPATITVSLRNDKQTQDGKHAATLAPAMRAVLDRWLEECGKTYKEVSEDYYHRAVCNVMFFRKVSELKADRPYQRSAARRGSIW